MEPSPRTPPFPESDNNGNPAHPDLVKAAERVKATTARAIDRTAVAASTALDEVATRREQWRASQQRLASDAADSMRTYPLVTIALAFGAGFLISQLLGGRDD